MSADHHEHALNPKSSKGKEQITNRLKRIEGQVRGIQNMIENDRYCVDILVQISAVQAAMQKVAFSLLEDHTHHCVANAIKSGEGEEAIEELLDVFKRFSKS
ncbi:copper-sensing transcriptional repressor CsoR [Bacillus haynesii]|uniref:copper-sensing transcriptional repressor CsoR n=1 Tax=Bacillus haynesii TaxID=1925021 RepID=UPI00227DF58A|nr:copper-sensing transcriptional repressor CsoR [Bacillus haynesii]MCY8266508.1 copper-sensing transcriptional repressor CsoR [Bacillus haynesii]MCY8355545.1 copper-sensing transcriptional repressor CsoR [Bacillus haynesii]MCY8436417.1 copper-sensing transcriptional repressor CsoR [Bacillus haynesii]MCY8552840.1 copper-sensing transcriptional repressor CsoR [Bacillus haynesii]MCY8578786.1 copper-sensing transcriptional repressor CsoR [Bacillus haynesii]